jgi:hypothetical protein
VELPADDRASFMRSVCMLQAGAVDLRGATNEQVQNWAMVTVHYANAMWDWLQSAKA